MRVCGLGVEPLHDYRLTSVAESTQSKGGDELKHDIIALDEIQLLAEASESFELAGEMPIGFAQMATKATFHAWVEWLAAMNAVGCGA